MSDGYLAEVEIDDGGSDQEGRTLTQLKDIPCLVLLGAPGMGKTREAEAAVTSLRTDGELIDLVYAGRRADPSRTLHDLLQGTNCANWVSSGRPWYIFIDGVDEAAGAAAGFEAGFQSFLDGLLGTGGEISTVRLRLLCRTVEWTGTLDRALETIWTDQKIQKRQIAPLRQIDVRQASDISTGDRDEAKRFMDAMADSHVQALASRPVSFQLLANLFTEQGRIPPRQADLYRLGLQALLDEPDDYRRGRGGRAALDSVTRLTVAARIAAATAFSGVSQVWTGLATQEQPTNAFSLNDIEGGVEPTPPFSFPVREADLLDAVRTPLFVAIGQDIYTWAHQTFMEYLAARYLVEHGLSPVQVMTFLSTEEIDGEGGIAPQLREIAAWVATMMPTFFKVLAEREPDILLQSDVAAADPADRKRLFDALLERLNAGELVNAYAGLMPQLGKLAHPDLAFQVRNFVRDQSKRLFARRAAIDIAEANHLSELTEDFVQIALAEKEPVALRKEAAIAVARLDRTDVRARLVPLLKGDLSADTSDELRGAALLATWPEYLKFTDLLEAITPIKDPNLIGSYSMFLYRLDLKACSPQDARAAIEWLRTRLPRHNDSDLDSSMQRVMPKFFWAAAAQSGDKSVREALGQLIAQEFQKPSHLIFDRDKEKGTPWPSAIADRLHIVEQILKHCPDQVQAIRYIHYFVPDLIRTGDLAAYLVAIKASSNEKLRIAFADTVATIFRDRELDSLNDFWDVAEEIPEVKAALKASYHTYLDSPDVEWMRNELLRSKKVEERKANRENESNRVAHVITETLGRIEQGEIELWWQLNLQLFVSATGRYESEFEFRADLRDTPGWIGLSELDQQRIIDGAFSYLTHSRLNTLRWLGTNTQHRPASAGFRAFRLIRDERPEMFDSLPFGVWKAWAPATIGFFDNNFSEGSSAQAAIVRRAYEVAPDAIICAIIRMALGPKSTGVSRRVLELLEGVFDERLGVVIETLVNRRGLRGTSRDADLRAFLVRMGYRPAVQSVMDALATHVTSDLTIHAIGSEHTTEVGNVASLAGAAAQLLADGFAQMWDEVLALRIRDATLAKAIWEAFSVARANRQSAGLADLLPDSIASAYLDLEALFPKPQEAIQTDRARLLSAIDHIDQVKGGFLNHLVARGTQDSVIAVGRIADALPETEWLRWRMQEARQNFRAKARQLYPPHEVIRVIGALQPPLPVRNEVEAFQFALARELGTASAFIVPTDASGPAISSVANPIICAGRRLKIVAIATEWRSGHGGISTLNRELCLAMAALDHEVWCVALDVSEKERLEAQPLGVALVECPVALGIDKESRSRFLLLRASMLGGTQPDVVIGHDLITGHYGLQLSKELGGIYAHFLHTVPEESEGIKDRFQDHLGPQTLRGDDKREAQIALCKEAQLVISIGPKIHGYAAQRLRNGPPLHEMMPGLNPSLLRHQPDLSRLRRNHCLLTARMQGAVLKGVQLGCEAIRKVGTEQSWGAGLRPWLVIRGFDPDVADNEFTKIGLFKDFNNFVQPRKYTHDVIEIHDDIKASSLVIMPSISEGFGLSAFEAVAAGVPVLVSYESGLAEYILTAGANGDIDRAISDGCVANVVGENGSIADEWADKINRLLSDRPKAFERARALRMALAPLLSWSRAAEGFSKAVCNVLDVAAEGVRSE